MKDLSKLVGKRVDALCTRMGGRFATIYCATTYEITEKGTLKYCGEWMSCVANKEQWVAFESSVKKHGYISGRPTLSKVLMAIEADKLILQ